MTDPTAMPAVETPEPDPPEGVFVGWDWAGASVGWAEAEGAAGGVLEVDEAIEEELEVVDVEIVVDVDEVDVSDADESVDVIVLDAAADDVAATVDLE